MTRPIAPGGMPLLHRPVAVFDAGIGSYAAVTAIQRLLPRQDILYLADRASFPYGSKSRPDLLTLLRRTLLFLDGFTPAAIMVASNAPSITVLDDLEGIIVPPIFGVRPPIREALDRAGMASVAVLGVRSMVESPHLRAFADAEAGDRKARVHLIDASPLVDLVEGGVFLTAPETTHASVAAFMADVERLHPDVGAVTLSSTHLPWLRTSFERCRPELPLLDPLDKAVASIVPHAVAGSGTVAALVTESAQYSATAFQAMLARLGVSLPLHLVTF